MLNLTECVVLSVYCVCKGKSKLRTEIMNPAVPPTTSVFVFYICDGLTDSQIMTVKRITFNLMMTRSAKLWSA